MTKRIIFVFLVFLGLFFLKDYVLEGGNFLKEKFLNFYLETKKDINAYFKQAEYIKKLYAQNIALKNENENLKLKLAEYEGIKQLQINKKAVFTKTISYSQIPNISRIYIDFVDKNMTHFYGLTYNNCSSGIVIKSFKNYSLALLNNDSKTTYTVYIGENQIPAIFFGGNTPKIKYIPKHLKVNVGDKVYTSGLDNSFYEGIFVGTITKIIDNNDIYKEALINLCDNSLHPKFFYVIK